MRNLHKLYYKDYFSGVDFTDLDSNKSQKAVLESNRILTQKVSKADLHDEKIGEDMTAFELQVQYPGLITGVGIQHEASVKGEFKLGLHLDYTTGLPVVYGSSVKGVLRSYFAEKYRGDADVERLVADIFDGKSYSEQGRDKSVYCRDVFYDAVVVSPNSNGQILAPDALAPHGTSDPNYPFIDPTPIQFVKIATGTVLKFRFKLVPTKDGDTVVMSAKEKKALFEEILTTYGIGAKTNVGYGQLKAVK